MLALPPRNMLDALVTDGTIGLYLGWVIVATAANITAVDYSNPAAPTITIGGSAVATTAGTHFAFIPNPNSATAPNFVGNMISSGYAGVRKSLPV